jgi:hypothetical protein
MHVMYVNMQRHFKGKRESTACRSRPASTACTEAMCGLTRPRMVVQLGVEAQVCAVWFWEPLPPQVHVWGVEEWRPPVTLTVAPTGVV